MPDRILGPGRWALRVLGWVLIVLMVATGITATVYAYIGANAVQALKQSSARGECRARVINADEDEFRHRIGMLLDAAQDRNGAEVKRLAHAIETEIETQSKIDDTCPASLASGKPNPKENP